MRLKEKARGDRVTGAVLRDGRSLRIRPISPADSGRIRDLFYRLSPRTRYLRFGHVKEHITDEELVYYTGVTPPERGASVATIGEGERERIIAVGRWDMLPDGRSAEVAFTVEDDIQLRGVGTILLEDVAREASAWGINRFVASVLSENTRMLDVFTESGFRLDKSSSEGVFDITIDLTDQEEYEKRKAYREHVARSAGVKNLLEPARVAVVGASRDPDSVGGALFRNMLKAGFAGAVFPVNPNAGSIAGVLAYKTVGDVPGDIDLAVIVVPAGKVLEVVDQAAEKGARGLIIISAGFSEAGPDGVEREKKLREKVLSYGLRVIGPNCLGVLNNTPDVRMNATFSPITAPSGGLSIGSQSGALGIALLDYARSINLGVAHFVSFGNSMDASAIDMLEYWEDDENTAVVALYLESFGEPRKFGRTARRVSHTKPIIAVKAGRSIAGARAAGSHTGALAASDIAVDALFRQAGVIRVGTIEEMFNAAEVFSSQPLPKGNRVGILTNAGGPAVLATDACEGYGLATPELSEETKKRLREVLPAEASVTNPVDMLAAASAETFAWCLKAMIDDPGIDSVIVIYIPPLVTRPEDVAGSLRRVIAEGRPDKPVITCFMMPQGDIAELRRSAGYRIRPFIFPEDAVRSLSITCDYSRYRDREEGRVARFPGIDPDEAREELIKREGELRRGWLMPESALWLMERYGIPVAPTLPAETPGAAREAADKLGYPVAMKVRSRTIVHKTDVGGVAVGLRDGDGVERAFADMKARVEGAGKGSEFSGVILQPVVGEGAEMIVGMSEDPVFGPLVMTGFGGVFVELLKDVAFSIHPLRDVDPDRMLSQLRSLPLLKGWRGKPPNDIESLKDVLLRFSALIEDFPEISVAEVNPLIVMREGEGSVAVDARIRIRNI